MKWHKRGVSLSFFMTMLVMGCVAQAQVIIVDRRPEVRITGSYEVRSVEVDARVRDQVAEVQVSQTFHNPTSATIEAEYLFPVPEDVAVQSMVLLVDGKELPGKLMDKDEARRVYEEIVRRKKDPALLEFMGRGLFRTSVFPIPPRADREVTLRYTQLVPRDGDVIELRYPFGAQKFTSKPIETLRVRARIESAEEIKSVYSPGHDVAIDRHGDHEAVVSYEARDVVPVNDFQVIVSLRSGKVGGTVLSYRSSAGEDGYFMLLASPRVERARDDDTRRSKCVIFVLDRSGSMSGKKIEQARESLRFVLDNLNDDDLFNIVVYDDRVERFKPELQRFDRDSRAEALRFVENIRPGGSTNIDEALRDSLELIQDERLPSYVLFLTDGLPTAGETKEIALAENVAQANERGARLFAFGLGYDVNARLLDRLSGQNHGTSVYVTPDQDIEAKVAQFFARITSPVLTSLAIEIEGSDVNRTYPRDIPDLFEGGQLVWVGRYTESGPAEISIRGRVGDQRETHRFDVTLAAPGEGSRYQFVAKLWAVRRIGAILDQIDLHGENRELTDELVALSKEHGILTPYTAFLADEETDLNASVRLRERAGESLRQLSEATDALGVEQRAAKQSYMLADRAQRAESQAPLQLGRGGASGAMGGVVGAEMAAGPMGGAATPYARPAAPGLAAVSRDLSGGEQVVESVRTVGSKTFYRRGAIWVDAALSPDEERQARLIEQFSDAYFALARRQTAEENQFLAFQEPVIVKLDGQVYRIQPAPGGD